MTEADLADTSISLRDVQAVLLSMFSSDTILIGHSLESDLLALKVPPGPPHPWLPRGPQKAGGAPREGAWGLGLGIFPPQPSRGPGPWDP